MPKKIIINEKDNKSENKKKNKDENQKGNLLKLINKEGFLLELKTKQILINQKYSFMSQNQTFFWNNRNHEIDFLYKIDNLNLIIECKKTSYSWFFFKCEESLNTINFKSNLKVPYNKVDPLKLYSLSNVPSSENKSFGIFKDNAYFDNGFNLSNITLVEKILAIQLDDKNYPVYKDNKSFLSIQNNRNDINDAINQVIGNVEGVINYFKDTSCFVVEDNSDINNLIDSDVDNLIDSDNNIIQEINNSLIIPIIVTNARLIVTKFSKDSINTNIDLELDKVNFFEYDFLAINSNSIINLPLWNSDNKKTYLDSVDKTVFIVNINFLNAFIKDILPLISVEFNKKKDFYV
ncbi:MAG: hypothetical protein PHR26_04125 [Candidatus ainarchaeum sp.]|nr:hypothetical protein [Candidatus ainarchaeum sp.]MDD3976502.1 hypothetical protein [Candidatus ainarchaeum sp.]